MPIAIAAVSITLGLWPLLPLLADADEMTRSTAIEAAQALASQAQGWSALSELRPTWPAELLADVCDEDAEPTLAAAAMGAAGRLLQMAHAHGAVLCALKHAAAGAHGLPLTEALERLRKSPQADVASAARALLDAMRAAVEDSQDGSSLTLAVQEARCGVSSSNSEGAHDDDMPRAFFFGPRPRRHECE